jgi:hypothetical protein
VTDDELKQIEIRKRLAVVPRVSDTIGEACARFVVERDVDALVAEIRRLQHVADFHIKAHDLAEQKREKYRRALTDASNALPSDAWTRIAGAHGIEYAENTTPREGA